MDEKALESVYQENLEERIIIRLAEMNQFSYEKAMDIYYSSKLSYKIQNGQGGIQYLDYKVLAQILVETEEELMEH